MSEARNITATEIEERYKSPAYRFNDARWEPLIDALLALARKHMEKITIAGYAFTVPTPYATGHVCSEGEAQVLNRKLHENLRANFVGRVKEAQEENRALGGPIIHHVTLQGELDSLASSYRFGGPDPSEVEAHVIASEIVRQTIKAAGKVLGDYTKAQLSEQARAILSGPQAGEIRIMARERVAALQAAAKKELARVRGDQS